MKSSSRRSRTPSHEKANGVHYTPPDLAGFLAAQTFQAIGAEGPIKVLDPACGDGGLLLAFSEAVPPKLRKRLILTGYEMDSTELDKAKATLSGAGVAEVVLRVQDFLSVDGVAASSSAQRNLLEDESPPTELFDAVIANPPYVRTQVLGAAKAQELAARFGLTGRVDLYHAFVKAMSNVLKPGGVLGLLTSNRFLTVRSGESLRHLLRTEFVLKSIYDLGDTKLFTAAVLPVVLVATKQRGDSTDCTYDRVYEHRKTAAEPAPEFAFPSILDALQDRKCEGLVQTLKGLYALERGVLSVTKDEAWSLSTPVTDTWLLTINDQKECSFSDVGKIRVGIKTTADEVFIRNNWDSLPQNMQPEDAILRPLFTHYEAGRWFADTGHKCKQVLYPHTVKAGRKATLDLSTFPKAEAYLKSHEERLRSRKYVIDAGRQWYEIWVPQNPNDWKKPKIVYPDISEFPRFFLETTGAIVNGDCYWITVNEGADPDWLLLMLAVANSTFITRYYDAVYHNKLYSGRRRFMTQYVGGFPLPPLKGKTGKKIVKMVSRLVESGKASPETENEIDGLVWESFGLQKEVAG